MKSPKTLTIKWNGSRTRPLEKEYSGIWFDALYEKVRCEKHIISIVVAIVQGQTSEGSREILEVEPR